MAALFRLIVIVGLAVMAAVGLTATTAPAATTMAAGAAKLPTSGMSYVALGDSYAAGLGIAPATGEPVAGCEQSAADYPHRIAEQLSLRLTDVSCSGAVTADLISTAQKTGSGTAPPQSAALGRSTRVVTVTIGGNDLGFFTTLSSCIALSADGPLLASPQANCEQKFVTGGTDTLAARVARQVLSGTPSAPSGLTAAFAHIRRAAPNARVYVIGYPTIMPDAANTPTDGCFRSRIQGTTIDSLHIDNGFPFTDVDVTYLHSVEQALDTVTSAAARRAGFTYFSTISASAGHSACAAPSAAYINGVSFTSSASLSITVASGALHPNAAGAAFLAKTVVPQLRKDFAKAAVSPATSTPGTTATGTNVLTVVLVVVVLVVILLVIAVVVVLLLLLRRRRRSRD